MLAGRVKWVTAIRESTCCDEVWVFYAGEKSQNPTPEAKKMNSAWKRIGMEVKEGKKKTMFCFMRSGVKMEALWLSCPTNDHFQTWYGTIH